MYEEPVCKLVRRCASSPEKSAWEEFVDRFGPRVVVGVRRALLRVGFSLDPETVEDMVQEVYCRLLERNRKAMCRCRARSEGEVVVFLNRVAANVVMDLLRAQSAIKRGNDRVVRLAEKGNSEIGPWAVDPGTSPEQRVLLKELQQHYAASFRKVVHGRTARRNVRILELALLEGWSSWEISDSLGGTLKPSSIDSLLHRMRGRLRERGLLTPERSSGGRKRSAVARGAGPPERMSA